MRVDTDHEGVMVCLPVVVETGRLSVIPAVRLFTPLSGHAATREVPGGLAPTGSGPRWVDAEIPVIGTSTSLAAPHRPPVPKRNTRKMPTASVHRRISRLRCSDGCWTKSGSTVFVGKSVKRDASGQGEVVRTSDSRRTDPIGQWTEPSVRLIVASA